MFFEQMVSVIVPVYNAEKYLVECVTSITNQTYTNLEILLIDDGSTDDSLSICNFLAGQDERIKVYHQENRGVSFSRNFGMEISCGKYITFVDADDRLSPIFIQTFMQDFDDEVDVVFGGYEIYRDNVRIGSTEKRKSQRLIVNEEYDFDCLEHRKRECWGVIYKREIVEGISFNEQLFVGEDTLFLGEVIKKCKTVYFESQNLYWYRKLDESAYNGHMTKKKLTELDAWVQICLLYQDWNNSFRSCKRSYIDKLCSFYLNEEINQNCEYKNYVRSIEKNNPALLQDMSVKSKVKLLLAKRFRVLFLLYRKIKT